MAIVLSEITQILPQADGRRYVTERHVDQKAREYINEYLADLNADINALLTVHAQQIWASAVEGELDMLQQKLAEGILGDMAVMQLDYCTRIEAIKKLVRWMVRQRAVEALKAIPLYNYIKNNYTAAQIATALGVSVTVVNAVLARFNILERDLKTLLEADELKVTEL